MGLEAKKFVPGGVNCPEVETWKIYNLVQTDGQGCLVMVKVGHKFVVAKCADKLSYEDQVTFVTDGSD